MRSGVRIGIDVGKARIGVARSDFSGMLAVPVETVQREPQDRALERVRALVGEYDAMEIVVGLPINLQGDSTPSTQDALSFAAALSAVTDVPIRTIDERLSTRSAARSLRESGVSTRSQRPLIDQQAAVVILQQALEFERLQNTPPGTSIVYPERPPG